MEECRADALPDDVPVRARAHQHHLLVLHNLLHLRAHLAHGLAVDEVVGAPLRAVAVGLPLVVHVQEGQVVRLEYLRRNI